MTQTAPTSDCEVGKPKMTAKSSKNDIKTIRPKRATGLNLNQVSTPARGTQQAAAAAAAADMLGGMPGLSHQEQLQEIEDVSATIGRARTFCTYSVAFPHWTHTTCSSCCHSTIRVVSTVYLRCPAPNAIMYCTAMGIQTCMGALLRVRNMVSILVCGCTAVLIMHVMRHALYLL